MSDNSLPEAGVSGVAGVSKKNRRGKRGGLKKGIEPVNNAVQQFLDAAMESLNIEPKKRPPRLPKVKGNGPRNEAPIVRQNFPKIPLSTDSQSNNAPISPLITPAAPPTTCQVQAANPFQFMDPAFVNSIVNANSLACVNSMIVQNSQRSSSLIANHQQERQTEQIPTKATRKRSRKRNNVVQNGVTEEDSALSQFSATSGENIPSGKSEEKDKAGSRSQVNNGKKKRERDNFPDHLSAQAVQEILASQKPDNIEYVQANIRINPKFFKEAYLAMPNGEADLIIDGMRDRNRALEGDLVVAKINPKDKWRNSKPGKPQKTATVVYISEKIHSRKTVGFLKLMPDNNNRIALFSPKDPKVPRLKIFYNSWPRDFYTQPDSFTNIMFLAEIIDWKDVRYALGKILEVVGKMGDLKVETNAILLDNDLDVSPYEMELTKGLPPADYVPTEVDIEGREDWRSQCIFTIDPETATDLDDAMSCKVLDNGNYEVGVHISDVTHYLEAFSPLDYKVSKRATTIYLSDSVHHMLPKQLCNVCSLLPGQDKLAFSVIWEMTPDARVVKHRFAKTVINSCCQLAYAHAQAMILNPGKEWSKEDLPEIKGKYEPMDLCRIVNHLNKLAVQMRENRFENGALRIDQPKLYVVVNRESGLPVSYTLEEQKDSNKLIEEFMLLANMTVATHLYQTLPEVSMLRSHQPPLMRIFSDTQATLQKLGVHLDVSSASSLQACLQRYQPDLCSDLDEEQTYVARCRMMVINALCAKPMTRARYMCTSAKMDEDSLKHYALNVPLYTHFTSPIRRYPDCVVHRLLHASIQGIAPPSKWTPDLCARIAANCNKQKYNAKRAQEQSSELYLTYYLELNGPIDTTAIVMDVKERSIDVIICEMGVTVRVYLAEIEEEATAKHSKEDDVQTITVYWKQPAVTQVINIFSILRVRVGRNPTSEKFSRLQGLLLPPNNIS